MKKLAIWFAQVLLVAIVYFVLAFVLMYAWNGVIPYILSLKAITYVQAMCFIVIIRVISIMWHLFTNDD